MLRQDLPVFSHKATLGKMEKNRTGIGNVVGRESRGTLRSTSSRRRRRRRRDQESKTRARL